MRVAGGIVAQIFVGVLGIVLLVGIAWIATWYRSLPTLWGTETNVVRMGKEGPIGRGSVVLSVTKTRWDLETEGRVQ